MDNYCKAGSSLSKNFFKEFLYCWNHNIFVPHYLFSCRISHYKSSTKLVNYSSSSNASILDKSLIRTYALIAVLRTRGFLNSGFEWIVKIHLGLPFEPVQFLYNDTAIIIGLVYIHLPFMILPIYAGLGGL